MKDVSLFLLKKVFKSRLNWIILLLFASVLGVTFYLNSQTANSHSLESRLESRIAANERAINENEEKLSQMSDTSSEEYQFAKNNLDVQKIFDAKDRNSNFTKRRALERSLLSAVAR